MRFEPSSKRRSFLENSDDYLDMGTHCLRSTEPAHDLLLVKVHEPRQKYGRRLQQAFRFPAPENERVNKSRKDTHTPGGAGVFHHRTHATTDTPSADVVSALERRKDALAPATMAIERSMPAKRWRVSRAIQRSYIQQYERVGDSLQKNLAKFCQMRDGRSRHLPATRRTPRIRCMRRQCKDLAGRAHPVLQLPPMFVRQPFGLGFGNELQMLGRIDVGRMFHAGPEKIIKENDTPLHALRKEIRRCCHIERTGV